MPKTSEFDRAAEQIEEQIIADRKYAERLDLIDRDSQYAERLVQIEKDLLYARRVQAEIKKSLARRAVPKEIIIKRETVAQELQKYTDQKDIPVLIQNLQKASKAEDANQLREHLRKLKVTHQRNVPLVSNLQNAELALAQEFPANSDCVLSGEDITQAKIKSGEQVALLDDGNAFDLKAFVEYHNQRDAGENCDDKLRQNELVIQDEKGHPIYPGKYLINPYNREPYSKAAEEHIFAALKKHNQGKTPEAQLKLYNVKGVNAGELSPKEKQKERQAQALRAEQEQRMREITDEQRRLARDRMRQAVAVRRSHRVDHVASDPMPQISGVRFFMQRRPLPVMDPPTQLLYNASQDILFLMALLIVTSSIAQVIESQRQRDIKESQHGAPRDPRNRM